MTKPFDKEPALNDYIIAVCPCGCIRASQRRCYPSSWKPRMGYSLSASANDPLPCPCCDDPNKAAVTKGAVQALKAHMQQQASRWLVLVEFAIARAKNPKRVDVMMVPADARTFESSIAIEIDPALHYENACQFKCKGMDQARTRALDQDEAKDADIVQMGVQPSCILRLTSESIAEQGGQQCIDARWLRSLDNCIAQALAAM